MFDNCPPLYECSICSKPVKVTDLGVGTEPTKEFSCEHTSAIIYANRKVVLRGKNQMTGINGYCIRFTMTLRQLLSALTGRSI